MHFDSLRHILCPYINIISELFRYSRKKSKCFISNCTAAMLLLSSFAIINRVCPIMLRYTKPQTVSKP